MAANTLPVRIERPAVPAKQRRAKAKAPVVARVAVYSPAKLAALRTAVALGAELSVSFDGFTLTITSAPLPRAAAGGER